MGKKPKDLDYKPELGDVLEIAYEINLGVAAQKRGESVGKVVKKFGSDKFLGFRLKVKETNHGDAIEELDVNSPTLKSVGFRGRVQSNAVLFLLARPQCALHSLF